MKHFQHYIYIQNDLLYSVAWDIKLGSTFTLYTTSTSLHYSLLELSKHLCNVGVIRESYHDIKLLQLHVYWIIVLHKEHFHLILQHIRPETPTSSVKLYDRL